MSALDEIRGRLDAATPGPLTPEHVASDEDGWLYASITHAHRLRDGSVCSYHVATIDSGEDDAEFIAHAPEDMRRLIAAVEAVLAVCEDPGGPDSWSHTFQGRHFVFADDVRAAITTALEATL